jgi:hypothetical protein
MGSLKNGKFTCKRDAGREAPSQDCCLNWPLSGPHSALAVETNMVAKTTIPKATAANLHFALMRNLLASLLAGKELREKR